MESLDRGVLIRRDGRPLRRRAGAAEAAAPDAGPGLIPLSRLLAADRPAAYPVARAPDGRLIMLPQLRRDVAHNAARIRAAGYRNGAVVCDDSYAFLVGTMALLHAGVSV